MNDFRREKKKPNSLQHWLTVCLFLELQLGFREEKSQNILAFQGKHIAPWNKGKEL